MNLIKANNGVSRIEEKKSILEVSTVVAGVPSGEMRIAKLALKKSIGQYPMEGENGLPKQVKLLTIGICRDYAIRGVGDLETFRFLDILRKYYSEMTLDEVRTAFELALVGTLDEYLPKDRNGQPDNNSYQIFSVEFISKILGAYKKYKGKIWSKVYRYSEKADRVVSEEEKEKIDHDFRNTVQAVFENYLQTGMVNTMFPVFTCDYLVKIGKIEDREITDKDLNKAVQILLMDEKDSDRRRKIFDCLEGGDDDKVSAMASRVKSKELILELFEKMKNEKQDSIWN